MHGRWLWSMMNSQGHCWIPAPTTSSMSIFITTWWNHFLWHGTFNVRITAWLSKSVCVCGFCQRVWKNKYIYFLMNIKKYIYICIYIYVKSCIIMLWIFCRNGIHMRRNSWQDGAQETNCPIMPGQNWTYTFQLKDQIGSFFYFPSLLLQKAGGGYGAVTVNNRDVLLLPFPQPYQDLQILVADWYNAHHRVHALYI